MKPESFVPRDADYVERIRRSFARQSMMATIGAVLDRIEPGLVAVALPRAPHILQQHGFVHGGVTGTIADVAAGYAALTLMPAGTGVLTVEFKMNLLAPGDGDRLVATGRVLRPGRTLTVCQTEVVTERDGDRRAVAVMTATMMSIKAREGVID